MLKALLSSAILLLIKNCLLKEHRALKDEKTGKVQSHEC